LKNFVAQLRSQDLDTIMRSLIAEAAKDIVEWGMT
jgi:hypothetical protein